MKNISPYIPDIRHSLKKNIQELPVILEQLPAVDLVDGWEEFSSDERLILFQWDRYPCLPFICHSLFPVGQASLPVIQVRINPFSSHHFNRTAKK